MTRRKFTAAAFLSTLPAFAADGGISLRGKLTQKAGEPSTLTIEGGKAVRLEGDEQTSGVLKDARLAGVDFEVIGNYAEGGVFRILPIHKRGLFVHQGGKRLYVTYWCEVCSIRTYTPGICWCCQENTALDLRDNLDS